MTSQTTIALPEATPRQRELQALLLELVAAYAFDEALALLKAWRRDVDTTRVRHIETVFLKWRALPAAERPDFLTYAHHRRNPELETPE